MDGLMLCGGFGKLTQKGREGKGQGEMEEVEWCQGWEFVMYLSTLFSF